MFTCPLLGSDVIKVVISAAVAERPGSELDSLSVDNLVPNVLVDCKSNMCCHLHCSSGCSCCSSCSSLCFLSCRLYSFLCSFLWTFLYRGLFLCLFLFHSLGLFQRSRPLATSFLCLCLFLFLRICLGLYLSGQSLCRLPWLWLHLLPEARTGSRSSSCLRICSWEKLLDVLS